MFEMVFNTINSKLDSARKVITITSIKKKRTENVGNVLIGPGRGRHLKGPEPGDSRPGHQTTGLRSSGLGTQLCQPSL